MHTLPENENVLLLQGPMGPFFAKFANRLSQKNNRIIKVNFNAGDEFFWKRTQDELPCKVLPFSYRGALEDWVHFLEGLIRGYGVTRVYLHGDCRKYHILAIEKARKMGVKVFVFEEGYVRPNYVTLEEGGVNGFSSIPQERSFYDRLDLEAEQVPSPVRVSCSYAKMAWYATLYYLVSCCRKKKFPHYQHHKNFSPWWEASCGVANFVRKYLYILTEKRVAKKILSTHSGEYYFVPLQVHDDFQVKVHSKYFAIEEFIGEVLSSFALNAPEKSALVFKHHPMDRGRKNYRRYILAAAKELGISGRVFYVHDVHLPTFLKAAKGVVVINSSVGLSALGHKAPLKVMGDGAVYDMEGLVFQGALDEFWGNCQRPDSELFSKFRKYLILKTQVNGSFFGLFPLFSGRKGDSDRA